MKRKRIAILGSTGSIGTSTLKVARHLPDEIEVKTLAAHSNIDLLEQQAKEFRPALIAVYDKEKAQELRRRLPDFNIVGGMEGVQEVAAHSEVDFVVSAMTGAKGILPTVTAIEHGKDIGLANKEVLVAAGSYVMALAKEKNVRFLPIDSEHTALFQCMEGKEKSHVSRLILTASGGPFAHYTEEQLKRVTVEDSLAHPNWKMGPKVTIDCSTLMNKGLEIIEAHWLFGIPIDQITAVIHPQSIIHSLVEFIDGSLLAQIAEHDMILPIQFALTYPERRKSPLPPFDFTKHPKLEFREPDLEKFRCLRLAFDALRMG